MRETVIIIFLVFFYKFSISQNQKIGPSRGKEEFSAFNPELLTYPEDCNEAGIQGTVFIKFKVTESGKLDSIIVIRTVHPSIDAEALKAVKQLPYWKITLEGETYMPYIQMLPVKFDLPLKNHFDLGCVAFKDGKYLKAIKFFEKSLKKSEFNSGALYFLGFSLIESGQYDQGLEYIKKAAQLNDFEAIRYLEKKNFR